MQRRPPKSPGLKKRPTSNIEHPTSKAEASSRTVFDLEERLLDYCARVIRLADSLEHTRAGNHIAAQILRSGTSPLANHGEAESAESISDFIHKLKLCLKELRETRRWMRLIMRVPLVRRPKNVEPLLAETEELIRIFFSSIRTATANQTAHRVHEEPSLRSGFVDIRTWFLSLDSAQ